MMGSELTDWPLLESLVPLGISAAIGLLIGLQRERKKSDLAGIRTFPLIALFGTMVGLIVERLNASTVSSLAGPAVIAGGFVAVAAVIVVGNLNNAVMRLVHRSPPSPSLPPPASLPTSDNHGPEVETETEKNRGDRRLRPRRGGITTEMAILVVYALGVYVCLGDPAIAGIVGVSVAVLLNAKKYLHRLVARMGEKDVVAILQFAVVSFVILPILPDENMGPMDVLNPRRIWFMVTLVVGMSLAGYVAYKYVAPRSGLIVAGLLGGVVSSTAVTVSYSRRASGGGRPQQMAALLVIMLASAVVYARVLVLIGIVAGSHLPAMAGPIGVMLGASLVIAVVCWMFVRKESAELPEHSNPSQLGPALVFGAIYACVLLATAYGKEYLGSAGIYAVAGVSGLTDMDAITLSVSQMVEDGAGGSTGDGAEASLGVAENAITASTAWRAILIAAASNMVFKTGVAASLGGRRLGMWVGGAFGVLIAITGVLIAVW